MGDLGGNNANGDNQPSAPFKFAKKVSKTLSTRELENLMDFVQQEIDERNRLIEFERVRQENAPLYEQWKRKRIARDVRKAREREERDEGRRSRFVWRKTRSATSSDSEEKENDFERSDDHERNSETEKQRRKREKKIEDAWYERFLAEKAIPRLFARTMNERLNVDSDGETIDGVDENGEPVEVGDLEEENEDDEGSEDAGDEGYGSATETGSQYSNDYSDHEMGIDNDDDSSQQSNENNGDDSE